MVFYSDRHKIFLFEKVFLKIPSKSRKIRIGTYVFKMFQTN
jgi:hypothetical protein